MQNFWCPEFQLKTIHMVIMKILDNMILFVLDSLDIGSKVTAIFRFGISFLA